ncbi:hypothetical protein PIROE2DRAFT_6273 [Piromyces sp. E2]|nr:hypothetical protein PIROE2DRAFT_6273 [Piromyces sp. E2]|eukprot:OUM66441.1 hypothetical protein PIROE2DRAFT_6273 [Piromyces sp. E2]
MEKNVEKTSDNNEKRDSNSQDVNVDVNENNEEENVELEVESNEENVKNSLEDFQHQPLQGVMYQLENNCHIIKGHLKPVCVYDTDDLVNSNDSYYYIKKNRINEKSDNLSPIIDIIKDNQSKKKKRYSQFNNRKNYSNALLEIDSGYSDKLKYKAKPVLPLTFFPSNDPNHQRYSVFYNVDLDHYYENEPPSVIQSKLIEGLHSLHLKIHRDLKL